VASTNETSSNSQ